MEEHEPVDLTLYDRNESIVHRSELQHQLITKFALRELGLFPQIVGGTEYYDPEDILNAMNTVIAAREIN
jgi:hypothetical protein